MTVEELKKFKLVKESDRFALYISKQTNKPNEWKGYRLEKTTNKIVGCKINMIPSPHVVELEYGDHVQRIIDIYRDRER